MRHLMSGANKAKLTQPARVCRSRATVDHG